MTSITDRFEPPSVVPVSPHRIEPRTNLAWIGLHHRTKLAYGEIMVCPDHAHPITFNKMMRHGLLAGAGSGRADRRRQLGRGRALAAALCIARRTIRRSGVTRFIAVCMLSGYGWLGVSGVLGSFFGGVVAGLRYDALLHTLFLGFVFSMIFGHAPIILPAVLRLPVAFSGNFYAPLLLLHLSFALRVTGDLLAWPKARRWDGLLNVLVLLVFIANTLRIIHRSKATAADGQTHAGTHTTLIALCRPTRHFLRVAGVRNAGDHAADQSHERHEPGS